MAVWRNFKLIVERGRRRLRSVRKALQLKPRAFRLKQANSSTILLFATFRNEMPQLEYFLSYYRQLGIGHFCFVDNGSSDGGADFLEQEPDCSLWQANGSYRAANYGMDWLNYLLNRYAVGRWVLVVDIDELLVFPHCDTRKLDALTHWLDGQGQRSMGAMLVDMYSDRAIAETTVSRGECPLNRAHYFDSANYSYRRNSRYRNLWIHGGPRQRAFFAQDPENAPALNKIPLVKWQRGFVFASSTHILLPTILNVCYETSGGELICGCLLHTKLHAGLLHKSAEELRRKEHFADSREYRAYQSAAKANLTIWNEHSTRYESWRTLETCGLMSSGGWF